MLATKAQYSLSNAEEYFKEHLQVGDYYMEGKNMVFTAAYHLKRGYCCGSKCRHCPYGFAADGAVAPVDVAPPAG